MGDLEIIHTPYDGALFIIYGFVRNARVVIVDFNPHSCNLPDRSSQNSLAALNVPYKL
jgi:hypothetical protein